VNVQPDALKAAIIYEPEARGGRQRLVVELNYIINRGTPADFGWVMPLPGKPEVSAAPADFFNRLAKAAVYKKTYLAELEETIEDREMCGLSKSYRAVTKGGGGQDIPIDNVSVISQQTVGIFEVSIVQAADAEALRGWARTHGYNATSLSDKAVQNYIKDNWYFVLARLPANTTNLNIDKTATHTSQPILLSFETAKPVYPWGLAAYNGRGEIDNNRSLQVLIYTLQPQVRLELTNYEGSWITGIRYGEKMNAEQSRDLLKGLSGNNSKDYYLARYGGALGSSVRRSEMAQRDLEIKSTTDSKDYGSGKMTPDETARAIGLTLLYPTLALGFNSWALLTLLILTAALIIRRPKFTFALWVSIFSSLTLVMTIFDKLTCTNLPTLALTGTLPYMIALAISLFALLRRRPRRSSVAKVIEVNGRF
jgi:hypothetical protein